VLSAVTDEVTAELPATERFVEAGRVAQTVARLAHAASAVERPWVPVGGDLVIEDWSIGARRPPPPATAATAEADAAAPAEAEAQPPGGGAGAPGDDVGAGEPGGQPS
jgi:hypothetical protein